MREKRRALAHILAIIIGIISSLYLMFLTETFISNAFDGLLRDNLLSRIGYILGIFSAIPFTRLISMFVYDKITLNYTYYKFSFSNFISIFASIILSSVPVYFTNVYLFPILNNVSYLFSFITFIGQTILWNSGIEKLLHQIDITIKNISPKTNHYDNRTKSNLQKFLLLFFIIMIGYIGSYAAIEITHIAVYEIFKSHLTIDSFALKYLCIVCSYIGLFASGALRVIAVQNFFSKKINSSSLIIVILTTLLTIISTAGHVQIILETHISNIFLKNMVIICNIITIFTTNFWGYESLLRAIPLSFNNKLKRDVLHN